jgi:hypothetical protein
MFGLKNQDSVNRSALRYVNPLQTTNQPTSQPTNQPINQPTNQPTNQPINQPKF